MKSKSLLMAGIAAIWSMGVFSLPAHAATLFISPPSSEVGVRERLALDLKIDSNGVSLNAAQATIRFPKDILEVVSVEKTGSAFSFWLEEPNFSNTDGIISFIGGTPYGVSGGAIQILKIIFTAKGSGNGIIALTDAAITASDGSGTNILSKTADAAFTAAIKKETPKTLTEITRTPIPTGTLPVKPVVSVPLYPNQAIWYNVTSPFHVNFDLPLDVIGVNTILNMTPTYLPPQKSEGLFDNKIFPLLRDGIWYLHVRFQNDRGWGPTAHYRLAVDTQPPLSFEATVTEGEATDNPTPTVQFKTSDTLSGLNEYQIYIEGTDAITIPIAAFNGLFELPLQAPGKRHITVKALDHAGNSIEDSLELEIVPIASPVITFVTQELFSDEEKGLSVKGASLPATDILLTVHRKGALIADGIARADEKGNWEFTFDQSLRNGNYILTAKSRDARGALSLSVEAPGIRVQSKPIIQIGALQLGKGGAIVLLLLTIVAGFGGGFLFYKKKQETLSLRLSFVGAEISKIFQLIQEDVERLHGAMHTSATADDEYAIQRLKEHVRTLESYLRKGVEKIKK